MLVLCDTYLEKQNKQRQGEMQTELKFSCFQIKKLNVSLSIRQWLHINWGIAQGVVHHVNVGN